MKSESKHKRIKSNLCTSNAGQWVSTPGAWPQKPQPPATTPASAEHWTSEGELVSISNEDGFYCVDTIHAQFAARKHNEALAQLQAQLAYAKGEIEDGVKIMTLVLAQTEALQQERDKLKEILKEVKFSLNACQLIIEDPTARATVRDLVAQADAALASVEPQKE